MVDPMRLIGWKSIAAHLGRSERTAREYSDRDKDPLPVRVVIGRVEADSAAIDEWIKQQGKPRGEAA